MVFGRPVRGCGDSSNEVRGPRSKLAIISPSEVCRLSPLYPDQPFPGEFVACRRFIRTNFFLVSLSHVAALSRQTLSC